MNDIRWYYTSPDLQMQVANDGLEQTMGVQFHVSHSPKMGFALSVSLRPPGNPDRVTSTWFHYLTDPILAWRAAIIGEKLTHLNYSTLKILAAAADRTGNQYLSTYVDNLIGQIGLDTYHRLNRTPVPEHLIDFLVHTTIDDLLTKPNQRWTDHLVSFDKEAMRETLKWREEFHDFGLINLKHWHRRTAADKVAEKYKGAFKALSADFGFKVSGDVDPHRLFRQLLLRAEEKNIHQIHGPDLAFGMALHLLRGATQDSLIGVSHWLPGRFEGRKEFGKGRVRSYQDQLESLTYAWFGRTK